MNTFEFIDNGKSVTIKINNQSITEAKNIVKIREVDNSIDEILVIKTTDYKYSEIRVDVTKDTITGVGAGSTTATELKDSLKELFFLEGSGGGATKQHFHPMYVKAGTINNVTSLTTHSAFAGVSGHFNGSSLPVEIYAITLNARSSVAAAAGNFTVAVVSEDLNSGSPHAPGSGTSILSKVMLETAGPQAISYNEGAHVEVTPVTIPQNQVYFVDVVGAGFWTLQDLEITLHIREV